MLCYPEAARSVLRMVSLQRKQPNIKALLAITFLGLVFILFPQKYLGQSFGQQIEAISNISHPSPSLDFLRLWHPPWTRTPENNQATTFDSQGPACEKTLLFRFAGAHGFASEYLIFLRVFLLAKYFGFEVIIDDHQWNYGKWTE